MDVYCATCKEPWEVAHMLQEAPFDAWDGMEGSVSHVLIHRFLSGKTKDRRLPSELRDMLKEHGWVFADRHPVAILECSACGGCHAEGNGEIQKRKDEVLMIVDHEVCLDSKISALSAAGKRW